MHPRTRRWIGVWVLVGGLVAIGPVVIATADVPLPPLPKGVSSFGATICDGHLYVYGGHAGKTHQYDKTNVLGTFYRLNLQEPKQWEELPGGPHAQGLNLVSYHGTIYRVGGMQPRNDPGEESDNHSLDAVACFDPKTNRWKDLPPLPAGRSSHDMVIAGDWLVVVGGWQLRGREQPPIWHDTTLLVNLQQQPWKWEAIEQPFQRRALAAVAVGHKVYVIGGLSPDGPQPRVDILDLTTRRWQRGPDLPGKERAAFAPAACTHNGQLIVYTMEGNLYRLAPDGSKWETLGQARSKRLVARLLPWSEHAVLLMGGAGGGRNHDTLEVIQLPSP